ncbi:TetR/AcrR family transcriptional regulator [Microbacterium sp. KR10-403]|uniref:TetR/AcrR family transcriptional regulator n=1 Tax=Microbacterium sp. KR10-403 TaxID=3158581 RepID=UPI0032E50FA0
MEQSSTASDAIRSGLQSSDDPRAVRTRGVIFGAVHALVAAGDDITVAAIVREAGISRASFYAHFADLDELAMTMQRERFSAIADLFRRDRLAGPGALRLSQERLVAHFAENRALFAAVAAMPTSKRAHLAGVSAMAALIEESLDESGVLPEGMQRDATARYIAGAAYGLLDAWALGEIEMDSAALTDHLVRLLPDWYTATEKPSQKG